jgi:hypothetical protein
MSNSGQRGLTGRQNQKQIKIKINCGDGWRYVN